MTISIVPVYPSPPPPPAIQVSTVGYAEKATIDKWAQSLAKIERDHYVPSRDNAKIHARITAILDRYVREASPGEDRATARNRVLAALIDGKRDATLALNDLGLLELPPILPAVEKMDFSGNRLSKVPQLHCGVKTLLLARNRIRKLANILPAQLTHLDVSHNNLSELSENLPNSLRHLDARDNGLRNLPARLPNALRVLHVERNRVNLTADRIASLLGRRAFNHTLAGAGITTAKVVELADKRRCNLALDAYAAPIELAKRQPPR